MASNLILRDVTGERGTLPLLQHALFELWKLRRGLWLTLAAYEQSGGVTGALKRLAQRIYGCRQGVAIQGAGATGT